MVSGNVIATVSKSVPLRAAAGNAPQGAGHGDRKRPAFRHVIGRPAMLLLVATIGGCAQIEALWIPPPPASSTPPQINYSEQPTSHYRTSYRSTAKRRYEAKESSPPPTATNDSPKTAPLTATPASSVTLADETLNKDLVAKQIRQVDDKLAGLNRSQLHDLDLVSYDHAKGFVTSAHKAFADGDYNAAAGLAEKASALAVSLQVKNDSTH